MGYYSNLSIDADPYIHDASITPPEQQLLWRLDDLRDLLHELTLSGRPCGGGCSLSESDLRYAPPGFLRTVSDVETAIELAIADLKNKYEIDVSKDMTFQEVILLSPYCMLLSKRSLSSLASDAHGQKVAFF